MMLGFDFFTLLPMTALITALVAWSASNGTFTVACNKFLVADSTSLKKVDIVGDAVARCEVLVQPNYQINW